MRNTSNKVHWNLIFKVVFLTHGTILNTTDFYKLSFFTIVFVLSNIVQDQSPIHVVENHSLKKNN